MRKLSTILALMAMLCSVGAMAATVTIPTADDSYISWNDATLVSCNQENAGANIGSTGNGSTATFTLTNSTQQDYYLTFASGAKGLTAVVSWTLTDGSSYSLVKKFNISNTDSWELSEKHGAWFTNVPAGTLTLTMKVESTTSSYAGNYGSLAVRTSDGLPAIPGTVDIVTGSYTGAQLENSNTNVGYVRNGTSAKYTLRVTQAGVYKMTIPMTKYGDGTITTTVTDDETGTQEAGGTWTMVSSASNYENIDVLVEGELTTGQKTLRMDFATKASFLFNYKSFTMTRVADHFARITSLAVTGQTVTAGDDSDWYCQLPAAMGDDVTFSVGKTGCTVSATAKDAGGNAVAVTDNGDGTFTLASPAPGTNTVVTVTLTPDEGAMSAKTEYTLKLFRIGEISLTGLTIDGIATPTLLTGLNDTQTATFDNVFTAVPEVKATVVDGSVITGTPTVKGTQITYALHAEMADKTKDYTLTLNGLHIYNKEDGDETVILKYTSEGNDKVNNIWSNGLYSLSPVGDGWNNSGFKLSKDGNHPFTLTVPSDVVVKQFIIHEFKDNYTPGSFNAISSDGMTAYVPYKHSFDNVNKYDLVINLEGHQAGQPIQFSFTDGSQITGWYELTIGRQAITTQPTVTDQQVTVVNNHAVVALTFDREMTETTATINGGNVTAEGGSATLYFPIWNLNYSTDYTLTIAAEAAKDTYGNSNAEAINVAVNTAAKPVVEKAAYDYVVSTAAEFTAAVAAVNASNTSASAARKTIFIKNGDYDFGSAEQRISGYNVSLIGESRDGVVLHGNRDGISNPVLNLRDRTGFYLQDLTVRNDNNYGKEEKGGVAVAIYGGDKTVMKNVRMLSNQDTQVTGHRAYFDNCKIHGTVDFICGGGDNYYWQTDLVLEDRGGNVIAAPSTNASLKWGYVFQQCTVSAMDGATQVVDGSWNLGRPWQDSPRCYYLNTRMNVLPNNNGWTDMSKLPTYFYEYGSTDKDGKAIDLSVRGNSPTSTNKYTPVLTAEEAAKFTVENVLGGTDSWLPTEQTVSVSAPTVSVSGTTLSWTDVEDARCYVVFKDGQYVANQTATSYEMTGEGIYTVRAANLCGGLGEESSAIVFRRTVKADNWSTVVVPFAVSNVEATFGAGTKVAQLTGVTGNTLNFVNVSSMAANEPYMIKVAANFDAAVLSGATVNFGTPVKTVDNVTFQGVYELGNIPAGAFFVSGNQLYQAQDGTNTIAPFRAYFTTTDPARELRLDLDGETTGVREKVTVNSEKSADAPVYNLNGQRVVQPTRGLYIVNGRKLLIP